MGVDKYKVIVEAIIDQAQLQQALGGVQATLNSFAVNKKIKIFDENSGHKALQDIKAAITSLYPQLKQIEKVKIFADDNEQAISAVVQFTDKLGLAQQAVLKIKEGSDEWAIAQRSVTQNLEKSRKEAERYAKEQEANWRKIYSEDQSYNQKKERMLAQAHAENERRDKARLINIQKQEAALASLEIKNKDAFAKGNVQGALASYNAIFTQFKNGKKSIDDVRDSFSKLKNEVSRANEAMRSASKNGLSFSSMLDVAVKKIAVWGLGTAAIYGSLRKMQDGIQYIRDLNKELTNVQIVTGASKQEVAALASEYNRLALELGATTTQVAQSSLTFIRQGKSAQESGILVRNSMMISKLANLESAQASEYLTSVMNGYQMSVEETTDAIDKMVSVDNAAATSVGELAEALSRTSSVAQSSGVSFENLVAYIGTVSSITRRNAESIGEAFKNFVMLMNMCYNGWRHWGIINNPQMKILFNDL